MEQIKDFSKTLMFKEIPEKNVGGGMIREMVNHAVNNIHYTQLPFMVEDFKHGILLHLEDLKTGHIGERERVVNTVNELQNEIDNIECIIKKIDNI